MSHLTVSEIVTEIGREFGVLIRPKTITNALYAGVVRNDLAPVVSGRRMVAREAIPNLVSALRRAGHLSA